MAPNFASVLDAPASELERPKPLPVGSYTGIIAGLPRFDKSKKKQTPFVEFTIKLTSAMDDVDPAELEQMGGLVDKTMKHTLYDTPDAGYRIKEFLLNDLGLELDDSDSLRPLLDQTPNMPIGIAVIHEPSQDGQSVFARIGSTFRVE